MLYKFKSKAAGDLIMTQPVGDRIMGLLDREPTAQGIFLPEQMPAAIAALEAAIAAEEAEHAQTQALASAEGRGPLPRREISLRQRAWPLIEMLRRCQAAGHEIVWGV
ncbi:MAG: DUF1840 domain-containing protein [Burkholderiales bacterium]